jgi:protease-4
MLVAGQRHLAVGPRDRYWGQFRLERPVADRAPRLPLTVEGEGQELLQKIGLRSDVIKSGEHKDLGSPIRPMTDSDRQILQTLIDDVHAQFIDAVAEGRKMEPTAVRALADGRIFTGRQAMAAGLVDAMGNLQDAIEVAADLGGIEGEPKAVYPSKAKTGILDYLIQETVSQLRRGLQEQGSAGLRFIWSEFD